MARLVEKVAIVTGSSSGIGKAIAVTLADRGAKVVIAARREELCQKVQEQIQLRGGKAMAIKVDITQEEQVEQLLTQTIRQFGKLDILVNNAGIGGGASIERMSTTSFDRILNTNLRGTFFCCRAGFRTMKAQGRGGIIINMSSVAGVDAWAGTGTYSASKYGIMGLTKALADEGRKFGIKVCAICPGGVAADLVDSSSEEREASHKIDPYDIAETVVYLAMLGPNATVHQLIVDRMGAEW